MGNVPVLSHAQGSQRLASPYEYARNLPRKPPNLLTKEMDK
jgi:hypothetical protein